MEAGAARGLAPDAAVGAAALDVDAAPDVVLEMKLLQTTRGITFQKTKTSILSDLYSKRHTLQRETTSSS